MSPIWLEIVAPGAAEQGEVTRRIRTLETFIREGGAAAAEIGEARQDIARLLADLR